MTTIGGAMYLNKPLDSVISFLLALVIHVVIIFVSNIVFVKSVEFAVEHAENSIEVALSALNDQPVLTQPQLDKQYFIQNPEEQILLPEEPLQDMAIPKEAMELPEEKIILQQERTSIASTGAQSRIKPNYLKNPAPTYPREARRLGQQGRVLLSVDVDRLGNPIKLSIRESSGYSILDSAALKAVSRWKFAPALIGTLAVDSTVEVPVRFELTQD